MVQGLRRQIASTVGDAVMHSDAHTNVVELQEANARLIAAAPEMLEALVECHRALFGVVERDVERYDSVNYEAIKTARAAIAKAKVET